MSNLTRLQAVSSSLDTAINKAENLPDAGGGGSEDLDAELTEQENLISELSTILDGKAAGGEGGGKVCSVSFDFSGISYSGFMPPMVGIYYVSADGSMSEHIIDLSMGRTGTIEAQAGLIGIYDMLNAELLRSNFATTGDVSTAFVDMYSVVLHIASDCTITW